MFEKIGNWSSRHVRIFFEAGQRLQTLLEDLGKAQRIRFLHHRGYLYSTPLSLEGHEI
jgi:hypothetical protein